MAAETFRITEELVVEDKTGTGFESAKKRVSAFDRVVEKMQERLKKATGSRWDLTVDAVDKATQVINAVENRFANAVGKAWNFTVGAVDKASTILSAVESKLHGAVGKAWDIVVGIKDTFTAPFRGILNLLKNPLVQAGAFLGVSFGIKDIAETGMSFETAMSQIAATMGTTVDEIGNLQATAQEMGSTTAFTATQAAEGLNILAMAGLKAEEQIAAIPDVLNLASAGAISLESAASYVVGTVKGFSDSMDNAQYYVDLIAKGATMANTSVSGLGEAFSASAADAAGYSQSADSVMVSLLRLAEQNITGAEAATALNRAMADIYTPSDAAQKALKSLGIAAYTSEGKARDFNDIVNELNASFSQMSDEQASATASTIFSTYGLRAFNKMAITTTDKLAEFEEGLDSAFGSAADQAATQLDNLAGDMTLLQSAADGVKLTISSRLSPYLRSFVQWLASKMPDLETAAGKVLDFLDSKIANLRDTVAEFTSSDEWANADIWGKIAIAWDKIVAEPFSQWWESSGKPWLTEKVAAFGETLGSGITAGLLALLGFDASGAVADGVTIGKSFFEGFKSGLDMDKISEAFTEWAGDHKGIVAAAGLVAGGKLIGGLAKAFQNGKSLFGGLFGGGGTGGGGGLGSFVSTMTVSAGTVIINGGGAGNNPTDTIRNIAQRFTGGNETAGALPAASGAGQLALPGAAGGTATATGLTSAGSWLSKLLTMGSSSSVVGADGTLLAVQGGVGGTLGSVGGALGSGATTAAGAAAAGTAAIGGGLLGGAGIISGLIDIFKGTQTTGKEAQDRYATGGTKIGMVGAGAAAGAAIGSVVPVVGTGVGALVGAGIGGLGALGIGDKIGKAISDALDEGGWLNNMGQAVSTFFTETLPVKWGEFWDGVGSLFTETIPYAIGFAAGKLTTFFTETIPTKWTEFWTGVGNFFTESIPAWWEGVKSRAATFFTETIPTKWNEFWTGVGNFFTESIPAWWENVKAGAITFFTETIPTKWTEFWTGVGNFFTESIPTWWGNLTDTVSRFFTETIPNAWDNFWGGVWDKISGFFGSAADAASAAFSSGYNDATSGGGTGAHAEGGIMHAPHMAQVAEDGPEAIIPLGASSRSRGMAVWEEAGDILGVNNRAPVGSNDNGLGDIIPESNAGGHGSPHGVGNDDDVPVYSSDTPGRTGPAEAAQSAPVSAPVSIVLSQENNIQATDRMSAEEVAQILNDRIRGMVDDIGDEMAEKLARIFANMPVRGGA